MSAVTAFAAISFGKGEVQVSATVDRNEVALGETFQLNLSVNAEESVEVTEPRLANLDGFDLLNSWSSSGFSSRLVQGPRGMEFVNQHRSDYQYMLSPKREGKLQIPAVEVVVDGKTYNTQPILIQVLPAGTNPPSVRRRPAPPSGAAPNSGLPGGMLDPMEEAEQLFQQLLQRRGLPTEDAPEPREEVVPKNPRESFFLHVEADKKEVYEGEQISVSWYLYTRGNILSLDRTKFPDLRGFWKEVIEEVPALNFTGTVLQGVPYQRALLASHALFPIRSGNAVIDEYKVKARVQVPRGGVFGGFGQSYSFERVSPRLNIRVKPLPLDGRPANFAGAVGKFELEASLQGGNVVPQHQPFVLKLRVEGSGNAKLVELPSITWPAGFEVVGTVTNSRFFRNGRSFKDFEISLIPRQAGVFRLPAIGIGIFDPEVGRYEQRSSAELDLQVTAADNVGFQNNTRVQSTPATPTKERAPVLPRLVMSTDAGALGWSGSSLGLAGLVWLFSLLVSLWRTWVFWRNTRPKMSLRLRMLARLKSVSQVVKKQPNKSFTAMLNLLSIAVGEVVGESGSSAPIEQMLDRLPPSLRDRFGSEILAVHADLLRLSFAPPELRGVSTSPTENGVVQPAAGQEASQIWPRLEGLVKALLSEAMD